MARARIEVVIIDGLDANDRSDAENVVSIGAAGNVGGGTIKAEQDLAVGIGASNVADEFAGDIAGVEIWKN